MSQIAQAYYELITYLFLPLTCSACSDQGTLQKSEGPSEPEHKFTEGQQPIKPGCMSRDLCRYQDVTRDSILSGDVRVFFVTCSRDVLETKKMTSYQH